PQCRGQRRSGFEKETTASHRGPVRQFICTGLDLFVDLLNAEDSAGSVLLDQPIPKRWTKVEAIVQPLSLDEDIRVEEICHQGTTPSARPSSSKVLIFEKPSIRSASR